MHPYRALNNQIKKPISVFVPNIWYATCIHVVHDIQEFKIHIDPENFLIGNVWIQIL